MLRTSLLVAAARCIYLEARGLTIPRQSGKRFTELNRVLHCAVRNLGGLWARLEWSMVVCEEEDAFAASVRFELCSFERAVSHLYDGLNASGRMALDSLLCDARGVVGAIEQRDETLLIRLIEKMRPEPFSDVLR